MRYKITIRKPEDSDMNADCPFPNTDFDNFIMHRDALLEDLKSIHSVIEVEEKNGTISIESSIIDKYEFWNSVKYLFDREREDIKFVKAEQIA